MGIRPDNIFVYYLNSLLPDHYQRTYSSYVDEMNQPPVFRLFTDAELAEFDAILFVGGDAAHLLDEVNRTGFSAVVKRAVENGLFYLGVSAGSMIAAGNLPDGLGYLTNALIPHSSVGSACGPVTDDSPIALNDNQAVWINGDQIEIVGQPLNPD